MSEHSASIDSSFASWTDAGRSPLNVVSLASELNEHLPPHVNVDVSVKVLERT